MKLHDGHTIEKELKDDLFLRWSADGKYKIYVLTFEDSTKVMEQIGRRREDIYSDSGGGTGKELDLDKYDLAQEDVKIPFKQTIIWDPKNKKIAAGYRHLEGILIPNEDGSLNSPMSRLFNYSEKFSQLIQPFGIELGRNWTAPDYRSEMGKSMIAWEGFTALAAENPFLLNWFGKVTSYPNQNGIEHDFSNDVLIDYYNKHHRQGEDYLQAKNPVGITIMGSEMLEEIEISSNNKNRHWKKVKMELGTENIAPMLFFYKMLCPEMYIFDIARNPHFGNVEETAIILPVEKMTQSMVQKFIKDYEANPDFKYKINPQVYLDFINQNKERYKDVKPFDVTKLI